MAKKAVNTVSPFSDGAIDSTEQETHCAGIGDELEAYRHKFLSKRKDPEKGKMYKNLHVSKQTHIRLVMLAAFGGMGQRPLSLQQVLDNILQEHFTIHVRVLKKIKTKTLKETEDDLDL